MIKPEPLFPSAAQCPECSKKIRIKWASPREVFGGCNGLGYMKCLHCGANHVRAVGTEDAIQVTSQLFAAQYDAACGHDHGHEGHEGHEDHEGHEGHDHNHGVAIVPGSDKFAYIKLPG